METTLTRDRIRMLGGLLSNLPKSETETDGFAAGRNIVLTALGVARGWRGLGRDFRAAGRLLQLAGTRIAALQNGSVLQSEGNSIWFIGQGRVFLEDPDAPIGTALSALQVWFNGQTYQAGLPPPPAPVIAVAVDATAQALVGRVAGEISCTLARVRSVTGGQSADSEPSNVVRFTGNKCRVLFPPAATIAGQDKWIVRFTEQGRGSIGPHRRLRIVNESEIAPPHGVSLNRGLGDGATTAVSVLSSASVTGLLVGLALRGLAAPAHVDSFMTLSAGEESTIRFNRSALTAIGNLLVAALAIKQNHQIAADAGTPGGTVKPVAVTGAWTQAGSELTPGAETVQLKQDSQTTFQWKLASGGVWSASLALATTPVALGATGLAVAWSAAASGPDEVGNQWRITPLAVGGPSGFALRGVVSASDTATVLAVFTRETDAADPTFYDFTVSAASALTLGGSEFSGVTLIAQAVALATASGTTHTLTFGAAPLATDTMVIVAAGAGSVTFSPQAPLVEQADSGGAARSLDFDFADSDLLDDLAERIFEPPPAGTHVFQTGPVMVVAGTSDGSGLTPSRPGQFEQYDPTLEVFLNPVEPIVRVETRPQDGVTFIATRNSLQTVIFTGNDEFPIIPRTIWPATGAAHPSGMVVTLRGVYTVPAQGGLVRSSGSETPDDAFADPVRDILDRWPAEETVLGYEPEEQAVVVACRKEMLIFYEKSGRWSGILDATDFLGVGGFSLDEAAVVSAVTASGRLYLSIGEYYNETDSGKSLYEFGRSVGTTWSVRSLARHGGAPAFPKTIAQLRTFASLTSEVELEYRTLVNAELRLGRIQSPGSDAAAGYAASMTTAPKTVLDNEKVYWEWTATSASSRYIGTIYPFERAVMLTSLVNLSPYGASPALPTLAYNSALSLVALRLLNTNNQMEIWKEGALLMTITNVLIGDRLRLEWSAGAFTFRQLRNGAQVGAGALVGAPSVVPDFIGAKIALAQPGGTLSPGVFGRTEPEATVKLYRNYETAPRWAKTIRGGGPRWHKWVEPNLRNCDVYQVELEGRGALAEMTEISVEASVLPQRRK
jgi:hypothetical protein